MMRGYGWDYGYGPGMMGWGGGQLIGLAMMFLFGLVLLAGVVLLVWWALRATGAAGRRSGVRYDRACEIARERLARGEITAEEYDKLRCVLEGETRPSP